MEFDILGGNIATVSSDAIVLPANSSLKEGSGASEAIFEAAGRKKLAHACEKIGCCYVGGAVPTQAFNLKAKYIIHAVVPHWNDGDHDEYNMLCSAYLSSLNLAEELKCKTIAFPLLASGNNGFDLELAFEIAKKSIEGFRGTTLEKAVLVVYGYRITTLLQEKGYIIQPIPDCIEALINQDERKENRHHIAEEAKKIGKKVQEDLINKAVQWIGIKENREKIYDAALKLVREVIDSRSKNGASK